VRRLHAAGLALRTFRQRDEAVSRPSTQAKRLEWAEQMLREWDGWAFDTVYVDESVFRSSTKHRKRGWCPKVPGGQVTHWVRRSGWLSVSVFGGLCGDELLP